MSWDVRTNIKAKPGSQGTLFQGGSDQMTDAKWPRHYTPERLHDVLPHVAPQKHGSGGVHDYPALHEYDTGSERRKLVDNVARSTVPVHHLLGVQFSPGKSPYAMVVGSGDSQFTAGGYYTKAQSPSDDAKIVVGRGSADHPVAIHEIGHHARHQSGNPSYATPAQSGHEEGKADAYAEEHFRDRRGRPTVPEGYRYMRPDSVRNEEFFGSYHATRPRTPELKPWKPQPHLPGLDAVSVYKAGRKKGNQS